MFAYCLNNPISLIDQSGTWSQWIDDCKQWIQNRIDDCKKWIQKKADEHYSRNDLNTGYGTIEKVLNTYEKQSESVDYFHENTSGVQGNDAQYNNKYLSPDGGHLEVIVCEPPDKSPYVVDQSVDPLNMGTYNYASNEQFVLFYGFDHFVNDMIPYFFFGNTKEDSEGLLKWALE